MGEVAVRHEVVGLEDALDVVAVDAHRDAHDHVLRALSDTAVDAEEVGALERFEAEAARESEEGGRRGNPTH